MIKLEDLKEDDLLENHVWKYFMVENIEYIQKTNRTEIFENSELSQAAYADFSLLVRNTDFYLEQFVEADITED